jgi:ABC-type glycerol-3-phosphate transport system substrate-binding protein
MKENAMIKRVLMVLVALALATMAWGAGQEATATASAEQAEPVVIMYPSRFENNPEDMRIVREYMEEQSGVKFETIRIENSSDYDNRLNIALAAEEKIDVVESKGKKRYLSLKQRGALHKLNESIDNYGQNLRKTVSELAWKSVTDVDGNIWAFPDETEPWARIVQIRKDWREELGLAPIETIDDLENYLRAVQKADLDGNGQHDTIPFVSVRGGLENLQRALQYVFTEVSGYGHDGTGNYLDENGKVTPIYLHPGYRDYLARMAEWFADGLIYSESYAAKRSQVTDLIIANRVAATAGWYSGTYRPWEKLLKNDPDAVYEFALPQTVNGNPYKLEIKPPGRPQYAVVSYSKNADWAVKLYDWLAANPTNYMVQKEGVPGQHWEWTGEPIPGERLEIRFLVDKSDRTKTFNWGYWIFLHYKWNAVTDNPTWLNTKYQAAWGQMTPLPGIYSPDWYVDYDWHRTNIENSMEDANTLILEAMNLIIMGEKPISYWDEVLVEYRRIFADEFIEQATIQYEKYQ